MRLNSCPLMERHVGPMFYRFINRSSANVRVYWVKDKKKRLLFNVLTPGDFIDVNTYPGHVWMFEKKETGDIMLADGCCLFLAQNWLQYINWLRDKTTDSIEGLRPPGPIPRKAVQILSPLYTLKEFALHAVRDIGFTVDDVESLHIPQTLKIELKRRVKDRECAVLHDPPCETVCHGVRGGLNHGVLPMSPPGLEALYLACRQVYPDQPNPLQVAAVLKYWLGGPDPLDYISMYSNPGDDRLGVPPHWHYISFGLSDLHGDGRVHERGVPDGPSGFGFELTFRLKRDAGETSPPTWPATLLQGLAKYVFHSGNTVCAGDHISWHRALDNSESLIQHMLLAVDPQLQTVTTPCGAVDFIQVVGVCKEELQAAQRWNGTGVLEILKKIPRGAGGGLWLVTDMRRGETMLQLDPNASNVVDAGIDAEGSNLSGVTANCSWTETGAVGGLMHSIDELMKKAKSPAFTHNRGPFGLSDSLESTELLQTKPVERVHLTFNLESGSLLPLAIRGRIKHGRHFTFKSAVDSSAITLVAESVTGTFVDVDKPYVSHGPWLQVLIKDEDADTLLIELHELTSAPTPALPKTYGWPDKNLSITIVADDKTIDKQPMFNVDS